MSLLICTYGNPILRKKAEEVGEITNELRELVKEMLETMYVERGVGLAAEQVGRSERMFIIDIPSDSDMDENEQRENPDIEMPLVCINPEVIKHSDDIQIGPEGCLSFPDIFVDVERWFEVDAEYTDLDGKRHKIHTKGLLARAIQHELDHLNGILLVDRMSPVKKVTLGGKLKRLVKETKKTL